MVSSPICDLDVLDRIGGGDGFASGLFYGLLTGEDPQEAVDLGWAHGALVTTFPGDTTMATLQQVRDFARGGSARVQRWPVTRRQAEEAARPKLTQVVLNQSCLPGTTTAEVAAIAAAMWGPRESSSGSSALMRALQSWEDPARAGGLPVDSVPDARS